MSEIEKTRKNWVATLVLCWFLGIFGAHRFYTRKTASAWVMLVMSITVFLLPISLIWALIDGITIALGKFTDAEGCELEERIPWFGVLYLIFMALGILGIVADFAAIGAFLGSAVGSSM